MIFDFQRNQIPAELYNRSQTPRKICTGGASLRDIFQFRRQIQIHWRQPPKCKMHARAHEQESNSKASLDPDISQSARMRSKRDMGLWDIIISSTALKGAYRMMLWTSFSSRYLLPPPSRRRRPSQRCCLAALLSTLAVSAPPFRAKCFQCRPGRPWGLYNCIVWNARLDRGGEA